MVIQLLMSGGSFHLRAWFLDSVEAQSPTDIENAVSDHEMPPGGEDPLDAQGNEDYDWPEHPQEDYPNDCDVATCLAMDKSELPREDYHNDDNGDDNDDGYDGPGMEGLDYS